ncbi:MAG TPA: hypothetical protein VF727_02330 [Allosphingosinicella sp.]
MIAALVAAAATAAPASPLPDYRPGDAFVFSDGRVERVRRVEGDRVTWSGLGSRTYARSRNPVVPVLAWSLSGAEGERQVSAGAERLWPLRPGSSARFRVVTQIRQGKGSRRSVAFWKCGVGRETQTAVPAGTFRALPIRCERYSSSSMRLAERIEWDWSPEVGHYVRRRSTLYSNGSIRELTLFAALPAGSATLPRLRALSVAAKSSLQPRAKKISPARE